MSMYQIEELVDEQNRELFQHIAAKLTILLSEAASDDGYWGAVIEDGAIGRIDWCPSQHPIACFTHELLHLRYDLAGKAKPGFKVGATVSTREEHSELQEWVQGFVGYAYNQLIHRKMYPEFVAMGFAPDQFTADSDAMALQQVEGDLETLRMLKQRSGRLTIKHWGMPFLSLVDLTSNTKRQKQLLTALKQLMVPQEAAAMTKFLREFDADVDPNVPLYMARLLSFAPNSNIEFGYSEDSLVSWPRN